jgi:hypothetical protein
VKLGEIAKYRTTRGVQQAPLRAACELTNGRKACGKCGKVFANAVEAAQHGHSATAQYWYCFEHGPELLANPTEAA